MNPELLAMLAEASPDVLEKLQGLMGSGAGAAGGLSLMGGAPTTPGTSAIALGSGDASSSGLGSMGAPSQQGGLMDMQGLMSSNSQTPAVPAVNPMVDKYVQQGMSAGTPTKAPVTIQDLMNMVGYKGFGG